MNLSDLRFSLNFQNLAAVSTGDIDPPGGGRRREQRSRGRFWCCLREGSGQGRTCRAQFLLLAEMKNWAGGGRHGEEGAGQGSSGHWVGEERRLTTGWFSPYPGGLPAIWALIRNRLVQTTRSLSSLQTAGCRQDNTNCVKFHFMRNWIPDWLWLYYCINDKHI